jgi:hypothetical protein
MFLRLSERVSNVQLDHEVGDELRWAREVDGCFLAKPSYKVFFTGTV